MDLTPSVVVLVIVVVAVSVMLLRWARRHEPAAPVDVPATPARSRGVTMAEEGASGALVNWLFDRAFEQTGARVADDPLARERIVQAAVKAMEDLRTHGSATISLPFLVADAQGPRHFSVAFKRNRDSTFELER